MRKENTIGENLKRLLSEKNIQQKEIAYACNKTESAITRWINGSVQIPISEIQTICDVLQVSADELLNIETKSVKGIYKISVTEKEKEIIKSYRNDKEFKVIVDRIMKN